MLEGQKTLDPYFPKTLGKGLSPALSLAHGPALGGKAPAALKRAWVHSNGTKEATTAGLPGPPFPTGPNAHHSAGGLDKRRPLSLYSTAWYRPQPSTSSYRSTRRRRPPQPREQLQVKPTDPGSSCGGILVPLRTMPPPYPQVREGRLRPCSGGRPSSPSCRPREPQQIHNRARPPPRKGQNSHLGLGGSSAASVQPLLGGV